MKKMLKRLRTSFLALVTVVTALPSTQLKKRIYDLKCSLHAGIIPVSVPPEVPLRIFPYNADVDWYVKTEDLVLKNKPSQPAGNPQNHVPQGQTKNRLVLTRFSL